MIRQQVIFNTRPCLKEGKWQMEHKPCTSLPSHTNLVHCPTYRNMVPALIFQHATLNSKLLKAFLSISKTIQGLFEVLKFKAISSTALNSRLVQAPCKKHTFADIYTLSKMYLFASVTGPSPSESCCISSRRCKFTAFCIRLKKFSL